MQTVMTNMYSENAQRQLMKTGGMLQTTMQRLSSGLRINSAKDDAAGLQISNRMSSQIRGLSVAMRNANDGISLAQTAEGAMEEVTNALLRMKELALQSTNGTYGNADKDALNEEFVQLVAEIDRIAASTEYNEQVLLNANTGDTTDIVIAIDYKDGVTNNLTIEIDGFGELDSSGDLSENIGSASGDAAAAIVEINAALTLVDSARAKLGSYQSRLQSTINNMANIRENLSASRSRIMDADFAVETANLSKYQVMQQAGNAILSQANILPQNVLTLLRGNIS
ncbi:MAG: flagellin [Endozoicomonas sp. (ex Botrylloides leachii)]|nr:flagellin [Endozoicomonas sp. (ex Botrylloides leachii)]